MKYIPSLLSDQPREISEQLERIAGIDELNRIQFDIIDGLYADNITITPADFIQFDLSGFEVDVHLMTQEPIDGVHEIIDHRRSAPISAIIGQVERMSSQQHFLDEVKKQGWKPGLSLDLHTPVEAIDSDSWEELKMIQVMGISAGFQGQELSFSSLEVVQEIKRLIQAKQLNIEIIFDGGVKPDNISPIAVAGAQAVTIGSGFWNSQDIGAQLGSYEAALESPDS